MEDGLYEIFFHTVHGTGSGVIYASGGKLRGGNSAFAFTGSYQNKASGISAMVVSRRYNPDHAVTSVFGLEGVTLTLSGRNNGGLLNFEGNALQMPGISFKAELTRISD